MKLIINFIKRHVWLSIFGVTGTIYIILFLLLLLLIIGFLYSSNNSNNTQIGGTQTCGELIQSPAAEKVLKYRSIVEKELDKEGISKEYTPCFLAQMLQESGGNPPDVFQASESKYGQIGMIKTVDESVQQAAIRWEQITELLEYLKLPFSIELVWQTYNFGSNYAFWLADNKEEYSLDTAFKYSSEMYQRLKDKGIYKCHYAEQKGSACYGDFMYVDHIKRYLMPTGGDNNGSNFQFPFVNIPFVVTSEFGQRWGEMHAGIDLVAYLGAPISAIDDGVVVASLPTSQSGGYGEMVTIKHKNGLYSRYGHMRKRFVKVGDKVKKGDVIGEQGNTGESTGSHLHLEIRSANDYDKGHAMNPRNYFKFP
ncbi:lysozyme family protein [Margalitia sp. FSL K6-0131]|uniref:lysozyme family protein n=1 Tax=Margalitia sp. FSL K6-0131 TaxID=2954604 RepID=UPI0030F7E7EE